MELADAIEIIKLSEEFIRIDGSGCTRLDGCYSLRELQAIVMTVEGLSAEPPPTREVLAGLLAQRHYGQIASSAEELEMCSNINRALKNFNIELNEFTVIKELPK